MDVDEEIPSELKRNVFLSTVDRLYNWARYRSMWPLTFGLACCAIEMICAGDPRYDMARFGMEVYRASPRQADLMIVAGTVTHKMAPQVKRIYEQMAEPKYVIAMGACACSGGVFKTYAVLQGVDKILPVDVYLPGCPPRPEALIYAIMQLHEQIKRQSITSVPWYQHSSRAG